MYITTSEASNYLWISWEDNLINTLISIAETKINNYLWVTSLETATYTDEKYDFNSNWPYYLKQINPTSLTKVDTVVFTGDYQLQGRELRFYMPLVCNNTKWNKIKFTYVAWFANIPDDIKKVMYDLIGFYYNNRKTNWITSFTQWQITVNYWNNKSQQENEDMILNWLQKYKKNNIYSV
jgi:hypothetical protein